MMRLGQLWRRKRKTPSAQFVATLERVREMREHSAWKPLTRDASIEQRAERVTKQREQLTIPRLASDREAPVAPETLRDAWLRDSIRSLFYGCVAILLVGAAALYILSKSDLSGPEAGPTPSDIQGAAIGFDLSESY